MITTKNKNNFLQRDAQYINRSDSYRMYLDDVKEIPMITPEEEADLLRQYKYESDPEKKIAIRNKIVEGNQRIVITTARKYVSDDTITDAINVANEGMIKAIETFDVESGFRLSTYAIWFMTKELREFVYKTRRAVSSYSFVRIEPFLRRFEQKFLQENLRYPTTDELEEMIGSKLYAKELHTIALSDMINPYDESDVDMDTAVAQVTNRVATNAYGSAIDNEENSKMVEELMGGLTDEQREVVSLRFGLCDDGIEHGSDTIALMLGRTKNQIENILSTSMRKMKNMGKQIGESTGYSVTPSQFKKVTLKKKEVKKKVKKEVKLDFAETISVLFDQLISDIRNGVVETLPTRSGGRTTKLSVSSKSGIKWLAGNGKVDDDSVSKEGVIKICTYYNSSDKLSLAANKFLRRMVSGNTTYYRHVAHYILTQAAQLTNDQVMAEPAEANA